MKPKLVIAYQRLKIKFKKTEKSIDNIRRDL